MSFLHSLLSSRRAISVSLVFLSFVFITSCVPESEHRTALRKIEQLERQLLSQASQLDVMRLEANQNNEHIALVISAAQKIKNGEIEEAVADVELIDDIYVLQDDVELVELALSVKRISEISNSLEEIRNFYGLSQNPTINHSLVYTLSLLAHILSIVALSLVISSMTELIVSRVERYVVFASGSIIILLTVGVGSYGPSALFSAFGGSVLSFIFGLFDYLKSWLSDDVLFEATKSFIIAFVLAHLFVTTDRVGGSDFRTKLVTLLMYLQLGGVVLGLIELLFAGVNFDHTLGIAVFLLTAFGVVLFHPRSRIRTRNSFNSGG